MLRPKIWFFGHVKVGEKWKGACRHGIEKFLQEYLKLGRQILLFHEQWVENFSYYTNFVVLVIFFQWYLLFLCIAAVCILRAKKADKLISNVQVVFNSLYLCSLSFLFSYTLSYFLSSSCESDLRRSPANTQVQSTFSKTILINCMEMVSYFKRIQEKICYGKNYVVLKQRHDF